MKKILLSGDLRPFIKNCNDILKRADFQVFVSTSFEDIITIHRAERVDLIILQLNAEDSRAEEVCSSIRKDERLKHVSILIICNNMKADIERTQRCNSNSYLTKPIIREQFIQKISQLLAIPERQEYRVLLKVKVTGKLDSIPFFCSSDNISASGMLIETEKKLEKGDIISCSFFLPKSEQILADAEVMRIIRTEKNSFQYGIHYMNLASRYRTAIDAFIRQRSGK
jgi:CheY-like chemotaxis protein